MASSALAKLWSKECRDIVSMLQKEDTRGTSVELGRKNRLDTHE